MAGSERVMCACAALAEGGDGVRFEVRLLRRTGAGVRGALRRAACTRYVNRCAHVAMSSSTGSEGDSSMPRDAI